MSKTIIAWLKLDKITSKNTKIKIIKILDKRLETNLGEDSGWYFKCEYEVLE